MRVLPGLSSVAVALAAGLFILAVAISPFLTPTWVSFEQNRADAAGWTGYNPDELRTATDSILSDLVLGPPNFAVTVRGIPVLTAGEREHMLLSQARFEGLRDILGVTLEEFRSRIARGAQELNLDLPTELTLESWWDQARTLEDG